MHKINKNIGSLIIISIIYLIVSVSYSYFSAIILGAEDTTTISLDSGNLSLEFSGEQI